MKLISWNVNGLRACMNKGFMDFFTEQDADIFCLQETKMQPDQVDFTLAGYRQYFNSAVKKGYSGTAIFTKQEPLSLAYGIGTQEHDQEGRVLTMETDRFYLVNVYTPNAKRGLTRLDYRMAWEDAFKEFLTKHKEKKPVIVCGDMNVAHKEIDLKNPKTNTKNAGFTLEERHKMTCLQESGFVDSFRYFYPDRDGAYTWWSYMNNAREKNVGWRIDYFLVSQGFEKELKDAVIYADVLGSDHCPIGLIL